MSHVTMRVGHFLHSHPFALGHFHPFTLGHSKPLATTAERSPCIVQGCDPSHSEDLAFFGLCRETKHDDPLAEIDRLALMDRADERSGGLDETVLFLL